MGGQIGIGYDPAGGTAWQVLTDPGDGSFLRSKPNHAGEANLSGTVNDVDGDPLSTTWSLVSGPGSVTFDNTSAVHTTAQFGSFGIYVLRLTVYDGYSQISDEVSITVVEPQSFASWVSAYELDGQTAPEDDFDGDGIPNAVENFFGTHPGVFNAGLAVTEVTTTAEGGTTFAFSHPMNENPATDLTAVFRWSKNLSRFHNDGESDLDGTSVDFVAGTPIDGEVTVTATITGTSTERFFVTVELRPN